MRHWVLQNWSGGGGGGLLFRAKSVVYQPLQNTSDKLDILAEEENLLFLLPFIVRVNSKKKEFAPLGANSFF